MTRLRLDAKDAIIEAAFDVFSRNPGAGLAAVADRAGVGRATLHRHFPGRAELMSALAQTAIAELDAAVAEATSKAQDHEEAFFLSMEAVIPLANRQWFLQQEAFDGDAKVVEAFDAARRKFHTEIEEAKAAGFFEPDLPTVWIAEAYENLIYAGWTLVRSGEITPKQAVDLAWRTFANGMKGDRK